MRRISIKSLMLYVSFIAAGLAALRNADQVWAGAVLLVTLGIVGGSILVMFERRDRERAWWRGFVLFGLGYLLVTFLPSFAEMKVKLPTTQLFKALFAPSFEMDLSSFPPSWMADQYRKQLSVLKFTKRRDPQYDEIIAKLKGLETTMRASAPSVCWFSVKWTNRGWELR